MATLARRIEAAAWLLLAVAALTLVPCALLTALAQWAVWEPHWLEPAVLTLVPAAGVAWFAGLAATGRRRHWWAGLIGVAAAWHLMSPHLLPSGHLSVGHPMRMLAAELELLAYGQNTWTAYRAASFASAGLAAVAAAAVAAWYSMAALQWVGDRAAARAPARPVQKLADASWATAAEVRRRFSAPGGIVLGEMTPPSRSAEFDPDDPATWRRQGRGPLISLDPSRGNAHSLVFSGSGSFKTAGVAIPNALTYAGPLIVVDPKGEIYELTAPVRRARGRRPWLITADRGLDPVRLLTALRPKDGTVFSDLAEFMLPTTGTVLSDGSAFFHQKSVRVLTALLAHLHHKNAVGHLFAKANALLAMETAALRTQFKEHAEDWREKGRDYDFITTVLAEVAATEDRQLSGVLATVANGLAWSGQPAIRGFLFSRKVSDAPARSDGTPVGQVLLDRVLDPLTDIYIRLPTEVMQGHPGVARALIGALVRTVRDSMPASASRGNAVHRLFILDEARALRRMDYLAAVRDEGRAQGIHLMQIFQSYQQLLECYGTFGAGAWVNSVDAVVMGPVSDARQAQELSQMIGRRTVTTASRSRSRSSQTFMPFSGGSGASESTSLRETELIHPSTLRQLPPETGIILATGTAPILATKAIWFTRKDMVAAVRAAGSKGGEEPEAEAQPAVAEETVEEDTAEAPPEPDAAADDVPEERPDGGEAPRQQTRADAQDADMWAGAQGWTSATGPDGSVREDEEPDAEAQPAVAEETVEEDTAEAPPEPDDAADEVPEERPDGGQATGQQAQAGAQDTEASGSAGPDDSVQEEEEPETETQPAVAEETADAPPGPDDAVDDVPEERPDAEFDRSLSQSAIYDALTSRTAPLDQIRQPLRDLVVAAIAAPKGTTARVVLGHTVGKLIEHHDSDSIVFLPHDGRSPIHRVVFDKHGSIIARPGPYHRPGSPSAKEK